MATTQPTWSDSDEPRQNNPTNSGANDNPDEFSEFRKKKDPGTEDYSPESRAANPEDQKGHVIQNQAPEAVAAAQNADNETQRAAWAADDPRYGSGPRPDAQRSEAGGGIPTNE